MGWHLLTFHLTENWKQDYWRWVEADIRVMKNLQKYRDGDKAKQKYYLVPQKMPAPLEKWHQPHLWWEYATVTCNFPLKRPLPYTQEVVSANGHLLKKTTAAQWKAELMATKSEDSSSQAEWVAIELSSHRILSERRLWSPKYSTNNRIFILHCLASCLLGSLEVCNICCGMCSRRSVMKSGF